MNCSSRIISSRFVSSSRRSRLAFTLLELLATMAILAVLAVASMPALGSYSHAQRTSKALTELSGAFERAREYAVSRNTFSWVVLRNVGGPDAAVQFASLASPDGSSGGISMGDNNAVSADQLQPIESARLINGVEVEFSLPDESPLNGRFSAQDRALRQEKIFAVRKGGREEEFPISVMFNPNGEAKVGAGLDESILAILVPRHGNQKTSKDEINASVVQILGLTGKVKVVRP